MKVVVAVDSFKGSIGSLAAGEAAREGIIKACPDATVVVCPLADGGEGTTDALTAGLGGVKQKVTVTDPLGRKIVAEYGILPGRCTAVAEMAAAAGLTLVPSEQRDVMRATTYGVGEMILDAIKKGCRRFIVGIGGSATNDGGAGMLQALGFGLLDKTGKNIPFGAAGLKELAKIDTKNVIPELKECSFKIACDVENPLCGENGCSAVFAPQKGANPADIPLMDKWLSDFAELSEEKFAKADRNFPGAGAAGGLGFAFLAYTDAVLESGVKIVLEETRLKEHICDADLVITGEGRIDGQTVMGKAPVGVAETAKIFNKPVVALAGCVGKGAKACHEHGIDAVFPVLQRVTSLAEAMDENNARQNITDTTEEIMRLICAGVTNVPKDG